MSSLQLKITIFHKTYEENVITTQYLPFFFVSSFLTLSALTSMAPKRPSYASQYCSSSSRIAYKTLAAFWIAYF